MSYPTYRPLTAQEEIALAKQRDRGDQAAIDRLIASQTNMVMKMATRYGDRTLHEDIVQEGMVGLAIAARRFDVKKNVRFVTYAQWWVRALMVDFVVRNHGPVRIGTTRAQGEVYFNIGRAASRLQHEGREETRAALAEVLRVSEAEVEAVMPRVRVDDISLDFRFGGKGDREASEFIADERMEGEDDIADRLEEEQQRRAVDRALWSLKRQERDVVRARFLKSTPDTLKAIGQGYGVSRERVRQIEEAALKKLRAAVGTGV